MAMNSAKNPKELKDLILRRLGAPVIQIEVTEDQIYDCIGRALELYKEYHYDSLNKGYITVRLTKEDAQTGYIDLSDYPIFAITKLVRQRSNMYGGLGGGASLNYFTDFLTNLGSGPAGSSYHGPYGAMGNIGFFAQFQSYQKLIQDQLDPLPDYWFDHHSGTLQVTGGNLSENDVIILEVYIQNFMDMERTSWGVAGGGMYASSGPSAEPTPHEKWLNPYKSIPRPVVGQMRQEFPDQGCYNVRWVKDYATTLTKEVWGGIMGKHQGMSLPGGITVDGIRLIEEARAEKETLRAELLLLQEADVPLMG
jgi:hypothetical protein